MSYPRAPPLISPHSLIVQQVTWGQGPDGWGNVFVRCQAMELAWTLPRICFSWVSSLAWALNPVLPLYLLWHTEDEH